MILFGLGKNWNLQNRNPYLEAIDRRSIMRMRTAELLESKMLRPL